jgi:hypothetical protein
MFFSSFSSVPQDILLIPLSLFIYLRSLSVRTFILDLFLPRTENTNQKKANTFLFLIIFIFLL